MSVTAPNPLTYAVATRDDFGDPWTDAPDLDLIRLSLAIQPRQSTAQLRLNYGAKIENSTYAAVAAQDLRGKLLRIILTDPSGTTRTWYGYCPRPTDEVTGTLPDPFDPAATVATGVTTFLAYDLSFFLSQHRVDRCLTTAGSLRQCQPFNRRITPRGTQTIGRRAAAKTTSANGLPDYYQFDPAGTDSWTALDALQHLLEIFAATYGIAYQLAGQYAALANVKGAWNLDGATYLDAVNTLVHPRTGFAWYLSDRTITVVTITDQALAGGLIPANATVVTLTLDQSPALARPTISHVESSHFDEIEVRGEQVRVTFTASYQYGSLDKGWSSGNETAYNGLSSPTNDRELYDHIYSRLELPSGWNQETDGNNVMPVVDESDGSLDVTAKQPYYPPGLVLDRNLALLDDRGQPRRPFVFVNDAGTYRRLDKPGKGKPSATVRVLDDAVGIQLDGPYPHVFGLNHYTGGDERQKVYDWQQIYATVGMALPERVRIVKTAATAEPGPVTKRKIITVPDAHLWYVVPDTITDASGSNLSQHAGGYVRDDRPELERIADLAAAWYGRRRAVIDLPFSNDPLQARLGNVISETYSAGTVTPTGTLVTAEIYDLVSRTTRLRTEFFDLDLQALAGAASAYGPSPSAPDRVLRIAEQLPNAPVRHALDPLRLFPVIVAEDGAGAADAGDATTACTYTYTVKDLDGTTIAEEKTPVANRAAAGKMVAATSGTAYYDNGVLILYWVDEVPDVASC